MRVLSEKRGASKTPDVLGSGIPTEGDGTLFAGLFGLFLGLSLLKFGNPILLDHLVETPKTIDEWRVFAWPVRFGYLGLAGVTLAGLATLGVRRCRPPLPAWILGLVLTWLVWQGIATLVSAEPSLSRPVLAHFAACGICFALGLFALGRVSQTRTFWLCLVASWIGVLGMAFDQHFGGLEATRRMILSGPEAKSLSPEYLARIQSNRVFSTLVYPNALAGVILMILPLAAVLSWNVGKPWGRRGSWVLGTSVVVAGLAVLFWSGSKAGWLIAMGLALFLLFDGPLSRRTQLLIASVFLVAGLTAFGFVFREKLSRGATSVSARFDYWTAASQGFRERPIFGHGPGVFKRVYARMKRPESEMAQLAHNDYLQQATDSGFPGFIAYAGFVIGSIGLGFRNRKRWGRTLPYAVWLGLTAWFIQGLLEFGLYIPASAWCAFALLGWLLSQAPDPSESTARESSFSRGTAPH